MTEERDVQGMIFSMEMAAWYGIFIGQVPFFHRFLVGSKRTMKLVKWLFPDQPEAFVEMFKVTWLRYH